MFWSDTVQEFSGEMHKTQGQRSFFIDRYR